MFVPKPKAVERANYDYMKGRAFQAEGTANTVALRQFEKDQGDQYGGAE